MRETLFPKPGYLHVEAHAILETMPSHSRNRVTCPQLVDVRRVMLVARRLSIASFFLDNAQILRYTVVGHVLKFAVRVALLAKAGFFRFAAYRINGSESWHNYAACRQLVYGDFQGATERYLEAIERDPKNVKAQVRVTETRYSL